MTEEQITEYLSKYVITSKELLAEHILQLKRNTYPNVGLISELVHVLEDEFSDFNSFSAKIKDKYKPTDSVLDETHALFEDFRNILLKQDNSNVSLANITEILTAKTEKKFFKAVDKIKISAKEKSSEEKNKDDVITNKIGKKWQH